VGASLRSKTPIAAVDWIRRFAGCRVLVAGDLMLDQFLWGEVERISPEAPVPVVRVTDESSRLGGAANVMSNLRALGGRVAACGSIGADDAGRAMLRMLRELDVDVSGVFRSRSERTIRKTRILAQRQQMIRLDREPRVGGTTQAAAQARGHLLANIGSADVVVLSDYGKGLISPELLQALATMRERRPFRLVIDPKDANFAHYRGASLVTPNRDEASRASGIQIRDGASLERAGVELVRRWRAEAVLITRGEEGMSLFVEGKATRHFPTVARHVYDVTGAGDTVIATCALALGAGADLPTAAILANHAAGLVVGEVGTATVSAAQLRADLLGRAFGK
jgi:D-beta-D-heptose 7-phosphate kinase/D-beta-D-heptose 1-phosphate adenosyltransferase